MSVSTQASSAPLPVKHRGLLMVAVMGATIVQILDSTIANVAIPHMQTSLGATLDTVTWVLTSYIVASAVAMPITGWLSDKIGSRRLFLLSVAGFIAMSMLCGAATSLTQMVIFRALQGVCAAFIGPLSQTILLDINPPEKAPKAMAIWGMGIMIAPIFGPMIGGWLTESYNWRWVFYINLPIGIPTIALLWWLLPSRPIVQRKLDVFGFSMLALGLATFQLMLDRGQHADWFDSWEIRIEAIIAIAALWMFGVQQVTSKHRLFSVELMRDRNYVACIFFSALVGLVMMASFALLPPLLQGIYGYTVIDTGILLAPRGLGVLLSMVIAARLAGRTDARWLVGTGFAVSATSLWMMTSWTLEMGATPIVLSGFVQGIGMGFTFMPLNLLAFSYVSPQHRTDGSSLLYLSRSLGGSIGISLTTATLARSIQTNHEELAGRITATSFNMVDPSTADRMGPIGEAALSILNGEVTRQAAMISYLNDFHLMMLVVAAFVPLIFFLRAPRSGIQAQPVSE